MRNRRPSDGPPAEEPETSRRKAVDLARQALQVAENGPGILANAALALALNPSFARGWYVSGNLRVWAGHHDLAIEHVETSLRLSPRERIGMPLSVLGRAYFCKRRFDEAAAQLFQSIEENPGFPQSYRYLAACYAHLGRLREAREIVTRLRAITPLVVPSVMQFRNPEDRELFLSGLRLAAGGET